jgi:hypothetical protein
MIKKFLKDGVPPIFCNYDTGLPFTKCSLCENELTPASKYLVEKVFKQNRKLNISEIVYEYAVCWDCASELGTDISKDSREAISAVFQEYQDPMRLRLEHLHSSELYIIDSWTERCTFTGKETRMCEEFAVSGIIEEGSLLYEHSPVVVSDDFMLLVQSVLSKETKETFDGLRDKILDGSPSVEDLIFSPTPGII